MNNVKKSLLVCIVLLLAGCGGGGWGDIPTTVTLNSIAVTPASLTVTTGKTAILRATGTYTDGSTADITSQVTWTVAASGTATVGSDGVVSGVAIGATTVTAKLKGLTSPAANITVTSATLSSIAITPASATIAVGSNANLSAIGTYSDSTTANLTTQVNWTSGTPATATVGANTGIVIGAAVGSTTVSAAMNGITSPTANITVTPARLTGITITPVSASVAKGSAQIFTATGTYSDSTTGNISGTVTWYSTNTAVASVNASGIASGLSLGNTNISASSSGKTSNIATLTVSNTAPVANAGAVQSVTTATLITLNGNASSDANGDPLTYSWTLTSKPVGSVAALSSATTATPTLVADLAGTYIATLIVNDGLVNSTAASVTITAQVPHLNDTGITYSQCIQAASSVLVACDSSAATTLSTAQDGMVGRDANPATNGNADGKLGFSFSAVTGGCVQDNVTGLMWEVKTNDGGLRDSTKGYTNYGNGASADASGFVTAVNASNLCGFNDWRLPTASELQSVMDYGVASPGPTIDTTWFPNTQASLFWSASPDAGNSSYALFLDFTVGNVFAWDRATPFKVRLVRAGKLPATSRYTISVDGQEVTDNQTNLIWRRCAEGMNWNGTTCAGTATLYSIAAAFQQATAQAGTSGWRLPNVKELASIVDNNFFNPAIDPAVFPATPTVLALIFLSSSPNVGVSAGVWVVDFNFFAQEVVAAGGGSGYVRLVRGGQ